MSIIEQLVNLLKLLKVEPASGWGQTIIKWQGGEIFLIIKEESIKPENMDGN